MNLIIVAIFGLVIWAGLGVASAMRAGYSTSKGWEYDPAVARAAIIQGPFYSPQPRD